MCACSLSLPCQNFNFEMTGSFFLKKNFEMMGRCLRFLAHTSFGVRPSPRHARVNEGKEFAGPDHTIAADQSYAPFLQQSYSYWLVIHHHLGAQTGLAAFPAAAYFVLLPCPRKKKKLVLLQPLKRSDSLHVLFTFTKSSFLGCSFLKDGMS